MAEAQPDTPALKIPCGRTKGPIDQRRIEYLTLSFAELDAEVTQAMAELQAQPAVAGSAKPVGGPVWKVPARLHGFTGREELLQELANSLRDGPVVVRAIEGMGGVGKSSTAIEYAHRHAADYDVVWWIAAENPDLVPQQLAELGQALRLTAPDEPVGVAVPRVLGELRARERVLVVFPSVAREARLPVGVSDAAITLGFLAVFMLSRRWFMGRFRPVLDLPHAGH